MALKTKSIREAAEPSDGKRICIMRKYNPNNPNFSKFDEHIKELSPSEELLKNSLKGLAWEEYVKRFTEEVLTTNASLIKQLATEAVKKDITLLCHESNPAYCHRRIIALACQMYNPNLQIIIK